MVAYSEERRDPTSPLGQVQTQVKKTELSLQAIFIKKSGRFAIINGRRLKEGQMIAGHRVMKIKKNHVLISYQGTSSKLFLRESIMNGAYYWDTNNEYALLGSTP